MAPAPIDDSSHYLRFASAFARGRLGLDPLVPDSNAIRLALEAGLRIARFKRASELPRVRAVLGILRGLGPSDLLDIGSGRGAFLWPLLDAFPTLPVTAVDLDPIRARDLQALHLGGETRLQAFEMDVTALAFHDDAFDVVTALEVLEHLQDPEAAARHLVRVARRFVVATVPSHPDDNPQHVQMFDVDALSELFLAAGVARVTVDHVLNHRVAGARVSGG